MHCPARRLLLAVLAVAALAAAAQPAYAQGELGAMVQLAGESGCFMQIGNLVEHECARAGALDRARSVTVSPDQRNVYVAGTGSLLGGTNGVGVFSRDLVTGALRATGCITANAGDARVGSEGLCARGDALVGASEIAISPDGAGAYVAASVSGAVSWLSRDAATGRLTPVGCAKDGADGARCARVPELLGASAVVVSPDGRSVYVSAGASGALHAFRRDPATGALAHVQCLSETGSDGRCEPAAGLQLVDDLAIAPDGRTLYASGFSGAVARFEREPLSGTLHETGCLLDHPPAGGPCQDADGIAGAAGIAVSPDSRDVYVAAAGSEAIATFRADPTGGLAQTGCIQRLRDTDVVPQPLEHGCTAGTAIWEPVAIAASADGRTVYAGGLDTITAFRRDPAGGALTQTGCAEEQRSSELCQPARATAGVNAIAASADGRSVYATAAGDENALSVFGVTVAVRAASLAVGRAGAVRVPLACPAAVARACAGSVALGGRARAFRLAPGARGSVVVRLPRALRRSLARRGRVGAVVRVSDARGVLERTARRVTLRG